MLAGLSPVDAAITAEEERIRKEEIESLAIEEKVRTLLVRTDKRLRNVALIVQYFIHFIYTILFYAICLHSTRICWLRGSWT